MKLINIKMLNKSISMDKLNNVKMDIKFNQFILIILIIKTVFPL